MKAELNKDNRIKQSENYEAMEAIRNDIAKRIQLEYAKELKSYGEENEKFVEDQKNFYRDVTNILENVTTETKLRVVTQVGHNSSILNTYNGHIEKKISYGQSHFNFVSEDRGNSGRPFTIGFSCLQSIEIL